MVMFDFDNFKKKKVAFYDIRIFAIEFFYFWKSGEDFIWLKDEWPKFEPYLNNIREAEDFILALSDIYDNFCVESYFAKVREEHLKKYDWITINPNPPVEDPEITKRIKKFHKRTLEILLRAYFNPTEIIREFTSILIDFEIPNPDGYKYIDNLYKDKFVDGIIKDEYKNDLFKDEHTNPDIDPTPF